MADANVALASGAEAQFINPAGLAGEEGGRTQWSVGSLAARVSADYNRPTTAGFGAASPGDYSSKTSYPVVPYAAISHAYSDRLTIGLSLEVPHGLGTEWKDHTFDVQLGPARLDLARRSNLSMVRVGPALAFKAGAGWSVGARAFLQYMEALEESDFFKVEGDGTETGYQLGLRYRGDAFVFGSAYTSRTNTRLTGTISEVNPVAAASGIQAGDTTAHLLLPDRWQTGLAFALRPGLWWETDLDWMGWSYVDELSIVQADGNLANGGKNGRDNDDTWSVQTGLKWNYRPDLTLHAGIGYDPNPVPEQDVVPTSSMLRKTRVAVGTLYQLSPDMKVGVAYQYVRGHSRYVNESAQDNIGGVDTGVFEGTYSTESHVLGLNIAGVF